jgi:hypothetical protein
MHALNDWLDRDVRDRQSGLCRVVRRPSLVSLRTLSDRSDTTSPMEFSGHTHWRPPPHVSMRHDPHQQLGDHETIILDAPTDYTAHAEVGTTEGPSPLTPVVYRPMSRSPRARSPRPVPPRTLPDRADTAPWTEYPAEWRPRLCEPKRPEPRQQFGDPDATSIMTDAPTEYTAPSELDTSAPSRSARSRRGRHDEGPDINFEARLRELRTGRRGGDACFLYETGSRPSTAVRVTATKEEIITDLLLPSQRYQQDRLPWVLNPNPVVTGSVAS